MRLGAAFVIATGLVTIAPTSVHACTSSGPEGYSAGLIWENPPPRLPQGTIALKVRYEKPAEGVAGFRVRVLDGPAAMIDRTYRVLFNSGFSCVGIGKPEGMMVVKSTVQTRSTPDGEKGFLWAVDFPPSWRNELLRRFGGEPWQYPANRPSEIASFVAPKNGPSH